MVYLNSSQFMVERHFLTILINKENFEGERVLNCAMGPRRREGGSVLKLVHPGRFVEVHRKPVAASEIMAKNPRHSITRPDVFRNPHVVVRCGPHSL